MMKNVPHVDATRDEPRPILFHRSQQTLSAHVLLFDWPRTRFHIEPNSVTHGPLNWPHRVHRCSFVVSS
jgi:hypothetical protein